MRLSDVGSCGRLMSGSMRELSLEGNDTLSGMVCSSFACIDTLSHIFDCLLLGNIVVLKTCTTLTSVNLGDCNKLTGEANEIPHPQAHLTHMRSRLLTRTTLSLPVTVHHTTPALLCGFVLCMCVLSHRLKGGAAEGTPQPQH